MKSKSRFEIVFPDVESMEAAAKAISHEGGLSERSKASVIKDEKAKKLIIEIEAKDVVALRATANAYLRALQAIEGAGENE